MPQVPAWCLYLALAALAFQAFFAMTHFGMQLKPENGAFVLLIAMCFLGATPWRELAKQPVTRLLLLFGVFLLLQSAYATSVLPAIGYSEQLSAASKLVRLGVFSCAIGWWLSLMPRTIPYLFALMVAGLLAAVLIYMPWGDLPAIWDGRLRPRFGIPENQGGLLAALGGWLALCFIVALSRSKRGAGRRVLLLAIGVLIYVSCFSALLFSQSRGAWLALLVTTPVVLFGLWWSRRQFARWRGVGGALLVVGLASGLLLWAAHDILTVRLSSTEQLLDAGQEESPASSHPAGESAPAPQQASTSAIRAPGQTLPAAPAATEGASASVPASEAASTPAPSSSGQVAADAPSVSAIESAATPDVAVKAVGIRMQMYRLGVDKWREHPWLGWGLRSTPTLIAAAALDTGGVRHVHLHNAYLDALIGMGLVGALLLGAIFVLLLRELFLAWRDRVLTTASLWAFAGCLGIVLVANLFDSLLWRFEYARAPLEILFGCCVAYGLIRRRRAATA